MRGALSIERPYRNRRAPAASYLYVENAGSKAVNTGWPADLTWYKLLTDWGAFIAGSLGFAAAIVAVLLAMSSERRKARREVESLSSSARCRGS